MAKKTKTKIVRARNEHDAKIELDKVLEISLADSKADALKTSSQLIKQIEKLNKTSEKLQTDVCGFATRFATHDLEPVDGGGGLSETGLIIQSSGTRNGKKLTRTNEAVFNMMPKGNFWSSEAHMRKVRGLGIARLGAEVGKTNAPQTIEAGFNLISNLPKIDDKKVNLWSVAEGMNETFKLRVNLFHDFIGLGQGDLDASKLAVKAVAEDCTAKEYLQIIDEMKQDAKDKAKDKAVSEANADADAKADADPNGTLIQSASNFVATFNKYKADCTEETLAEVWAIVSKIEG